MANGDAERTIRHSLLERPPGRNPRAPARPAADRPRCPIAPCRASKGLKMLKTTRASYWLELASIWDRRHVRLGSAPPRLRRRYARNDGKRPWKWEQSEPVALAKSRHQFLGVALVIGGQGDRQRIEMIRRRRYDVLPLVLWRHPDRRAAVAAIMRQAPQD